MAKKVSDKTPSGPQLDILTAQKVFGWKNVHHHDGEIVAKKQDKALALGKSTELLDRSGSCLRDRRAHQAARA